MRISIWLSAFFLFFTSLVKSQSLEAGSIAFIAVQGNAPVSFAFVTTRPIPANTSISFTDNKWTGERLLTNEQTLIWTSPDTTLPPGSIIKLRDGGATAGMLIDGPGTSSGRIFHFPGMGDQILAYTGASENPSFIAGISNNYWRTPCDSISFFEFRTCLPRPLVNGQTAICFVNVTTYNIDNGYLSITPLNITGPDMLPIINNVNYWFLDNGASAEYDNWPDWSSGHTQAFASEIEFAQEQMSITEGGPTGNIVLNINIPQPTPQTVVLTAIHFPGLTSTDYKTIPPVNDQLNITLDIPANASNYTIPIQALVDGIAEPDENLTLVISSLSGGLKKGTKDAISITIINADNAELPYIEFVSDTVVVTEGQGAQLIKLIINPPVFNQYYVIVDVINGPGILNDYYTTPALANHQLLLGPTAANSDELSFSVLPVTDFRIEPDEYVHFAISLITPEGLVTGNRSTMTMVIRDNDAVPDFIPPGIYINELSYYNQDFPDEFGQNDSWIELYNGDTGSVNLSGYYITNDLNNQKKFKFPQLSSQLTIQPGQYFILWADQQTTQGAKHLNFKLTQNGGFIGLYAPDGELLIDGTYYSPQRDGYSFGRVPDGTGDFKILHIPTPGAANTDSIPTTVSFPKIEEQTPVVFPNPAQGKQIQLVFNGSLPTDAIKNVRIADLTGRQYQIAINPGSKSDVLRLDISQLPNGFYYISCNQCRSIPLIICR